MTKKVMIQGTSSGAGKSIVATALCRVFTSDGHRVAPFKPQNMALNSFVTAEGLEMGRAQVVQAEASGKLPTVHMNPILLKPTGNNLSQVIVHGKIWENMDSLTYKTKKMSLLPKIQESYDTLAKDNDVIVIEGAGSPAELNMMENDISNMASAELLDAPVILVADIDRGGVFASIYGTIMLQDEKSRDRIQGIIINKFKGRKELLQPGIEQIEKLTGKKVLGVMPYTAINLEDEDSITEKTHWQGSPDNNINIEVVKYPHLSNSTDFEVLRHMSGVNIRFVELHENFTNPDLIILPGTKNTVSDLKSLKASNLIHQLYDLNKNKNVPVMGICGGFQMLGKQIKDPHHLEDFLDEIDCLGLLNHTTTFEHGKVTTQAKAKIQNLTVDEQSPFFSMSNMEISGYEVHSGKTEADPEKDILFTRVVEVLGEKQDHPDGIVNATGSVMGTYFHGVFDNFEFTNTLINNLRKKKGLAVNENSFNYQEFKEKEFAKLEALFRENVDVESIYRILK
ncbi:MAG: cobyric acid synthase [Peptostreptococcaceae bacterium]|nr:cobyric acid synthase [Peptostreptococcaceae bacterium]